MRRTKSIWILVCVCCWGWAGAVFAQGASGVSPNVLVLPQGPGSIGGVGENVQANLNMGLMSYSVRILKQPHGHDADFLGLELCQP
ncbi:MAG: hypothetical protein EP343_20815 [Deltaproteobacteria bacterium]|nr:MAG: hypothetical protein EP343_20815 [Deltaproteobacteria bacterium]